MNNVTEDDNRLTPLDEHLDAIEARIERLEKLYGTHQLFPDPHYTMIIHWSEEDLLYLVRVPELRGSIMNWNTLTHGDTYEEAARNGTEAIAVALADFMTTQALGE